MHLFSLSFTELILEFRALAVLFMFIILTRLQRYHKRKFIKHIGKLCYGVFKTHWLKIRENIKKEAINYSRKMNCP